ncbi:hypothetical protein [Cohnella sp. GCM10012308]|uniref:hypothetical protein n=1 Tax=Cohnella sp. GCM10012308 TaxID=3317329 RepID=UPI00360E529F
MARAELARILAEIDNPGLLVLDYVANVTPECYRETLPTFIDNVTYALTRTSNGANWPRLKPTALALL